MVFTSKLVNLNEKDPFNARKEKREGKKKTGIPQTEKKSNVF
jgi:hypothetical protein